MILATFGSLRCVGRRRDRREDVRCLGRARPVGDRPIGGRIVSPGAGRVKLKIDRRSARVREPARQSDQPLDARPSRSASSSSSVAVGDRVSRLASSPRSASGSAASCSRQRSRIASRSGSGPTSCPLGRPGRAAARPSDVSSARVTRSPANRPAGVAAPVDLLGQRVRLLARAQLDPALPVELDELVDHRERGRVAARDQLGPDAERVDRRTRRRPARRSCTRRGRRWRRS